MPDTGNHDTDAQLVSAYLSGATEALGAMYDRYASQLHDTAAAMLADRHEAADATHDVFVLAAERLGQLRDPSRLRPWLYAILRNEVYRRSRSRRRSVPTDFAPGSAGEVMAAPTAGGADASRVELTELAAELRDAARGLDERDQFVLELVARQQLGGDELAAALGVSVAQSYVVVSRMRDRVERSLGALAVARIGRRSCPDLDAILRGWDGTFSVLVRKRVARHVEDCATCSDTRRRAGVLSLVAAAPALAAPAGLRERVMTSVANGAHAPARRPEPHDGSARSTTARRRTVAAASAAAATVLVLGGALLVASRRGGETATPSSAPVTVAAQAPATTLAPVVAPTAGTGPATTAPAVTTGPPAAPSTTAVATTPTTMPTSTTAPAPVTVGELVFVAPTTTTPPESDPPRVEIVEAVAGVACPTGAGAPGPSVAVVVAVVDASAVVGVELTWTGPGAPGRGAMARTPPAAGRWGGTIDVDRVNGTWVYVATATDAHGNEGTATGNLVVTGC